MRMRGLAIIAALALCGAAAAQSLTRDECLVDVLSAKERGVLIGLADVIVTGVVRAFAVSPNDRYIAVLRMEDPRLERFYTDPTAGLQAPNPGHEILIWDELNRKLIKAADLGKGMISPGEFQWLSDGSAVVLQTDRREVVMRDGRPNPVQTFQIVTVNARTGRAKHRSWTPESGGDMQTAVSPVRPVIVEIAYEYGQMTQQGESWIFVQTLSLTSYDRNGTVNAQRTIELRNRGFAGDWQWSKDGTELLLQTRTNASPGAPSRRIVLVVDPMTLAYVETGRGLETYSPPARTSDLTLVTEPIAVERGGKSSRRIATWIEGDLESFGPRALVCVAPVPAQMSPRGRFLVYAQANALVVRRITTVDRRALEKARLAALRTEKLSNAKQLALGILMFAADHDGELPYSGSFQTDVFPYVKTNSLFEGFVYTYSGGALYDLEDPTYTEFGYILVDGGRVVAYADGRVKFIKDD